MKYLKITLSAFVISILLSVLSVKAGYLGITGVELPALGGEYNSPWKTKTTEFVAQSYDNTGAIDVVTGNYVDIKVRTEQEVDGANIISNYLILGTNESDNWGQFSNCLPGTYRVKIRRADFALTKANHSGIWYY